MLKKVFMEVHDKAVLQATLAEANKLEGESQLTFTELVTEALLNPHSGHSINSDDTFQTNVIVFTDGSGEMKLLVGDELNKPTTTMREVKMSEEALDYLDSVHAFLAHNWVLKRRNGEVWPCNLEGDFGKSRLIVSAAMRYLLDFKFKIVNGDNFLNIQRRTKLIGAQDFIEFYIIRIILYPQYGYSKGLAYCQKVKINFRENVVSSGPVETLEVKDLDREMDIAYDNVDYSQDIDDPEIESDEEEMEWER